MENTDKTINYVEFAFTNADATKQFYSTLLGWEFEEWGSDYMSVTGAGIDAGFNRKDFISSESPSTLAILYSSDLDSIYSKVEGAAGKLKTEIYSFPGGRRFHLIDPNGIELAIWGDPLE